MAEKLTTRPGHLRRRFVPRDTAAKKERDRESFIHSEDARLRKGLPSARKSVRYTYTRPSIFVEKASRHSTARVL